MSKLYQLRVKGTSELFDAPRTIYSRKVFLYKEAALAYIPEFKELAATPLNKFDLIYLDRAYPFKVIIIELDLIEEAK